MSDEIVKVVIVGAGVGGLANAKYVLGNKIGSLVILEQKQDLGGLWNPEGGYGWDSMTTNTSKYNCAFMGFPWDKNDPIYPNGRDFFLYMKAYAQHFGIDKHIRFGCRVNGVRRNPNGHYEIIYERNN